MKKIIPIFLYIASLIYVSFAFSIYSSRCPFMSWYEPDQMGIQLGLGMLRFLFIGVVVILCVCFLFKKYLRFMLRVLAVCVIVAAAPSFAEKIFGVTTIEFLGSGVCIVLFVVSSFAVFNQMKQTN